MQLIIDLDGTICTEEKTYSRSLAKPIKGSVKKINGLYNDGHIIIIYSSRTWMEYEMTSDWLRKHGIKYHQLVLGKPIGDLWIDDRALRFVDWNQASEFIKERSRGNGHG
jgi:uncharacterized HAD superfamily protein